MLIEYYNPGTVGTSVDTLLHQGIAAGAYTDASGWSYNGLITVAKKYGLSGDTHDYKDSSMDVAFAALADDVLKGPVMASVHYTFKSTNPIPHLVIIRGVKNGLVYYNDPAAKEGGGSISVAQFKDGWKKRYIEFYPQA
jgi:predicted double-glycine peptidase